MYNRLYELINDVENDILTFENLWSVFVAGDVNAKVGNKPECVLYDTLIETIDTNDYNPSESPRRAAQDLTHNARGTRLLDLCKGRGMRIVNGRLY